MKKIKSKLVYVNPSYRTINRAQKSPSPDTKNRSKIQRTQSPVKQIQHHYKIKQKISYHCSQMHVNDQKPNYHSHRNNISLSQFSVHKQAQLIDIDTISESIKLKSPASIKNLSHLDSSFSNQSQNYGKYHSFTENHKTKKDNSVYQTPKGSQFGKSNQWKTQFPVDTIQWKNSSAYGKMKENLSTLGIQNTVKISRRLDFQGSSKKNDYLNRSSKSKQSGKSKKSKRKLEIYSPSKSPFSSQHSCYQSQNFHSSSFQLPTREFPQSFSPHHQYKLSFQHPQQNPTKEREQQTIEILQQKLNEKQKQIQRMSKYVNEYEKLGQKNARMEKEMKVIYEKLIQMKQARRRQTQREKQIINHNQGHQVNMNAQSYLQNDTFVSGSEGQGQFSYESQSKSHSSRQNPSHPQSEIQQQNHHISLKKNLTDDYIKISEEFGSPSSSSLNGEQEQSYKPNQNKLKQSNQKDLQNNQNENKKKDNSVYCHRKMLSVGAKLKQSLNARNQDFRASIDDSILFSSSSLSQGQNKEYDFSKKPQARINTQQTQFPTGKHLKTEQTQGESLIQQDNNSVIMYEADSSIKLNAQNELNFQQQQPESSIKQESIIQPHRQQIKQDEETTLKKKPHSIKYIIKKKQHAQGNNEAILSSNNSQLTKIIEKLVHTNQSLVDELKLMNLRYEANCNKVFSYQAETAQIHQTLMEFNRNSQEIINELRQLPQHNIQLLQKGLNQLEEKFSYLHEDMNLTTKRLKKQQQERKNLVQNNTTNSVPCLRKTDSFGRVNNANAISLFKKQQQKRRKQSGSQFKQPGSPSFTYLEENGSFLTQSFRLSHSQRSNPSNSRYREYSSNISEQLSHVPTQSLQKPSHSTKNSNIKHSASKNQVHFGKNEQILIRQSISVQSPSQESNLLSNSSKGTSQFILPQSTIAINANEKERSSASRSRGNLRSQNSQIRINFDDLADDSHHQYHHFEIVDNENSAKSARQNNRKEQSITLMKSSFGPIMQKQMSKSQKGESIIGQSMDHVDEQSHFFSHQHPHRQINRPRQNSSINIFFSSDSICKSTKGPSNHLKQQTAPLYNPIEHNESSQASSMKQKCASCQLKNDQLKSLQTEASQMRKLISELSEEKDGLKKLVKSKVDIIDKLEISIQELQSLSSLQQIRSKPEIEVQKPFSMIVQNSQSKAPSWYKSINDFQYVQNPQINNISSSNTSIPRPYFKPNFSKQIQDVLPISNYLKKQLPAEKITSLQSIEMQIREELKKEQQLQAKFHEEHSKIQGKPLEWIRGSFSNVDELREESFLKTKSILLKLIGLIRQIIVDGNKHLTK